MEEKKYLKWYNKLGYGSGDFAAQMSYSLISTFLLIYLTDSIGMNSAIVGTLILISKLLDGLTDIFFGNLIDKTKSKLGKARPWMLYSQIGLSITLIMLFSIPSLSDIAQYAYFFITYTLVNAIFYTANNVSYSTLTSLITRNAGERVQLGSIRMIFSYAGGLFISYVTLYLVDFFGGNAAGWRGAAILYALIALVVNTFSVFSVKELPEEVLIQDEKSTSTPSLDKMTFKKSLKHLLRNKYYLYIVGFYIFFLIVSTISGSSAVYYLTYILNNGNLIGPLSTVCMVATMLGLVVTPLAIKKIGNMRKLNIIACIIIIGSNLCKIPFAMSGNFLGLLPLFAIEGFAKAPLWGDIYALIAETSDYTYYRDKVRIDGAMFSCTSMGMKLGSGLGTALIGWLLAIGKYDGTATTQSAPALNMIQFMFIFLPIILQIIYFIFTWLLKVEKANKDLLSKNNA